jgi:hypothetical protein
VVRSLQTGYATLVWKPTTQPDLSRSAHLLSASSYQLVQLRTRLPRSSAVGAEIPTESDGPEHRPWSPLKAGGVPKAAEDTSGAEAMTSLGSVVSSTLSPIR